MPTSGGTGSTVNLPLEEILYNKELRILFLNYLKQTHALEELEFWLEVEIFKRIKEPEECCVAAKKIYSKYLSPSSKLEINVDGKHKREVSNTIDSNIWDQSLFDEMQMGVYELLKYSCVRAFWSSQPKIKKRSSMIIKRAPPSDHLVILLDKYRSLVKLENRKKKVSIPKPLTRLRASMNVLNPILKPRTIPPSSSSSLSLPTTPLANHTILPPFPILGVEYPPTYPPYDPSTSSSTTSFPNSASLRRSASAPLLLPHTLSVRSLKNARTDSAFVASVDAVF